MSLKRACLTHLSPQDNAFDCSKPQSISVDEPQEAPPLQKADSYYHYLDRALADPHVYNIALAGHFGCGKSTILQTYQKHYGRKRRFLNISLATFGTDVSMTDTSDNERTCADHEESKDLRANGEQSASTKSSLEKRGEKENSSPTEKERRWNHHLVEHSILQQIFYQVPKSRIPRSRFKRISKSARVWPWVTFFFWLLCVGAAVALYKPGVFSNAPTVYALITSQTLLSDILLTSGALLAVILPATVAFYALRTVTLRKLNFKSGEIEISEEKDPSALNKHLDEILYFFEETKFDVVVLEDLDRFRTTDVFTKLREINTLVNRNIEARYKDWWCYKPSRPRRVVFIYAIKDDMFTGEERTKFFDLVIPVIPVVNHINSRELLKQALLVRGFRDISDELINDVAVFVRDMRLLHNVVNEYTVYRHRLNMKGLNPEKLFAMILYKNLCPEDFAKLHDSNGNLHASIMKKSDFLERVTKSLQTELSSIREQIKRSDAEMLQSVQELRRLYLLELLICWNRSRQPVLVLGEESYQWEDLVNDEPFSLLRQVDGLLYEAHGNNMRFSFGDVEKAVDPDRTYQQREADICARNGDVRQHLENRVEEIEDRIRELRRATLAELLEMEGEEDLPKTHEVVPVLLANGYIDESSYLHYLSYFYAGSLSTPDWVFVQGVMQRKSFEPDYMLENIKEVVERNLGPEERLSQACKNIHILHYIAVNWTADFPKVIIRFKKEPEKAVELVLLYLADGTYDPVCVIQLLHKFWPEFWQAVMDSGDVTRLDWKRYVQAVIEHLNVKDLKGVIDRTEIQHGVASDQRFIKLLLDLDWFERAIAFLDNVRPCIRELPEMDGNSPVARHIYEQGFYAVTGHNISLLHRLFIDEPWHNRLPTITSLREREDCPLAQRVEDNLETYIGEMMETDVGLILEDEPTIVSLLNDKKLSKETVLAICDGRALQVKQLKSVNSRELWSELLSNQAVLVTWENVFAYRDECADGELDNLLIKYLNDADVAENLSRQTYSFPCTENDEAGSAIMGQILASEHMLTSSVRLLLKALPDGSIFNDASVIVEKHLPVALPRIKFLVGNYEYIRTHAASSIGKFVNKNREDFYKQLEDLVVEGSDLSVILDAHRNKKTKREIASAVFANSLPDDLGPVADQLCELMFDEETFAEVFDPDTLASIICSVRDNTVKIKALASFMGQLSDDDIWDVIRSAGQPYEDMAVAGKRPLLGKGKMNSKLADALDSRGMISKAKEEKGGIRIITFSGGESV